MANTLFDSKTQKFNLATIMRLAHENARQIMAGGLVANQTYEDAFASGLHLAWQDAKQAKQYGSLAVEIKQAEVAVLVAESSSATAWRSPQAQEARANLANLRQLAEAA